MAFHKFFLPLILAVLGTNCGECAEFVPVYMWGTNKMSEHVPALHKISEDSFKDTLLEYLKDDPYVLVFAEHTLSPEDFAQHDQNGETAFPKLYELKKQKQHVTYKPYVQNPIGAIKQLDKDVTELSIASLLSTSDVPKKNILIIDLNDAKDDEQRFHMLKRHDSDIVSIYKDILQQHKNVLVIYTAHHTSWVAPEEVTHRKLRSLLQEPAEDKEDTGIIFNKDNVLLYLTSNGEFSSRNDSKKINITKDFEVTVSGSDNYTVSVKHDSDDLEIEIVITFSNSTRYWYINSIATTYNRKKIDLKVSKDYFAPFGFSYHCGGFNLTNEHRDISLLLPGFQIQPFVPNATFGDAYNCVGFTSVPIWSGLFVTFILLLIITFGLTMMMDIKTMDRFDDPKGKTITISATE